MELETILFILSGVLTVLSSVFGVGYAKVKKALKETKEAVVTVIDAVEDDKVTKEETDSIIKETKEMATAWGAVFKK